MGSHTPPLKKSKQTRGNATTKPRSQTNVEFREGKGSG